MGSYPCFPWVVKVVVIYFKINLIIICLFGFNRYLYIISNEADIKTNIMKNLAIHTAIKFKASMLNLIGQVPAELIKLNAIKIRSSKK